MGALQGLGNVVTEYVGDGQGETESTTDLDNVDMDNVDAESGVDDQLWLSEGSSENAHPLMFCTTVRLLG